MASYAHLYTDLNCPYCGALVTNLLWFQWGYCPSYSVHPDYLYRTGEAIRWMTAPDGAVPAWTYFKVEGFTYRDKQSLGIVEEANIGDPAVTDLIVREGAFFYWADEARRRRCGACDRPLEGAVVEIRGNVIQRAWIYRPDEFDHTVAYYVFEDDERLKPMPQWNDHSMASVEGGIRPTPTHPEGC
jgi:hypothetical protein